MSRSEAANGDQRDDHTDGANQKIDPASKFVTEQHRHSNCEDLHNIDDCVDGKGLSDTDRLCKNDTVGVPELDAIDLLSEHGTTGEDELTSLDRVRE